MAKRAAIPLHILFIKNEFMPISDHFIVRDLIIKPIRNAAKTSLKVPPNNTENEPAPRAEKIIMTGRG